MSAAKPESLDDILDSAARDTAELVYLRGAWVQRVPTVPIECGTEAVVQFASVCWRENISHKRAAFTADHYLNQASKALGNLLEQIGLNKELALALAAVQSARLAFES